MKSPVSPSLAKRTSEGVHSSSQPLQDYVNEYPKLRTAEQRARYKRDFEIDFSRYRKLYKLVNEVSLKFSRLHEVFQSCEYGSDEFKRVAEEIKAEYKKITEDNEYLKAKKDLHYLQKKIAHLKRRVREFDRRCY